MSLTTDLTVNTAVYIETETPLKRVDSDKKDIRIQRIKSLPLPQVPVPEITREDQERLSMTRRISIERKRSSKEAMFVIRTKQKEFEARENSDHKQLSLSKEAFELV